MGSHLAERWGAEKLGVIWEKEGEGKEMGITRL